MNKTQIRIIFGPDTPARYRPFYLWLEDALIYTIKYPNYFIKFF